ncbi:hypothetical protein RBG61_12595 [Paludicola sp. MB14-C6]|uniref:hypothetical protein n=1 Tax=Paludihabitans sp. MB14-C6 TaxID=3070656 RepID=UPI0027DB5564|nr:hypothetical protein [Paludicola sp. MB14-C6]WMJ22820.1 hypothetical protein RBG61_12595 [Paludicola sp. MB14-C6]
MNLITCKEDCLYQKEGYCKLNVAAPISSVKVNGCNYYKKRCKSTKKSQENINYN